jgi:hypothetical protein
MNGIVNHHVKWNKLDWKDEYHMFSLIWRIQNLKKEWNEYKPEWLFGSRTGYYCNSGHKYKKI